MDADKVAQYRVKVQTYYDSTGNLTMPDVCCDELLSIIDALTAARERVKRLEDAESALSKSLHDGNEKLTAARAKIAEVEKERDRLLEDVRMLDRKRQNLDIDNDALRAKNRHLRRRLHFLERDPAITERKRARTAANQNYYQVVEERDQARAERDEAREAITRMHRRAQSAEAGLAARLEKGDATIGRAAANSAATMYREQLAEAKAERDAAVAERDRLLGICQRAYEALPVLPDRALAFVDSNVDVHAMAVADEFAILQRQVDAWGKQAIEYQCRAQQAERALARAWEEGRDAAAERAEACAEVAPYEMRLTRQQLTCRHVAERIRALTRPGAAEQPKETR
jgi:hypothetical protein